MENFDLIPNGNQPFNDLQSLLLGPVQRLAIAKARKELVLQHRDKVSQERMAIIHAIETIGSSGNHNEDLYHLLIEAYYKIL